MSTILPELNDELASRRLQSKFPCVDDEEFAENRMHLPQIGKKQKKSIQQSFEYVWDYLQTELLGPSRVDAWYIAYALELLRIMLDCGHTDMKTINGLVDCWKYFADMPANFKTDYQRLFGDQ